MPHLLRARTFWAAAAPVLPNRTGAPALLGPAGAWPRVWLRLGARGGVAHGLGSARGRGRGRGRCAGLRLGARWGRGL